MRVRSDNRAIDAQCAGRVLVESRLKAGSTIDVAGLDACPVPAIHEIIERLGWRAQRMPC